MPVVELPDHVELDAPGKKVRELSAETQLDQPPSKGESFIHGLTGPFYGMSQIGAHMPQEGDLLSPNAGQADPALEKTVDTAVQKREADYQTRRKAAGQTGIDWWRGGGELTSGIAITAPLGVIAPEAAGATLLGRMGVGAGLGALGGAVTGATEPVTTKDGFAGAKLKQIGTGLVTGGALGAPLGALSKAVATDDPAAVDSFIRDAFDRAVKPSVSGKASAPQLDRYHQLARQAIGTIVENKPNLRFVDEHGHEIAGQPPRTLEQFGEAIDQTKSKIFGQYDSMAQRAGQTGIEVGLEPTVKELNTLASSSVVQDLAPDLSKRITDMADRLQLRGSYSPTEAQSAIQHLNASLKAFYRNPDYNSASRAMVDSMVANNLRKGLDEAIETTVAPGYQGLKNQYGALKAIENDVVKRAVVVGRQDRGGGILGRMGDVISAEEVLRGLATMRPDLIATGAGIKGLTRYIQYLRSPNRAISRIFDAASRTGSPPVSSSRAALMAAPLTGSAGTLGTLGLQQ